MSELIVESAPATPLVWFTAALRGGASLDPAGREGLTRHAIELTRRGAGGLDRTQLDAAVDGLGGALDVEIDRDAIALSGMCLTRNLDRLLELAVMVLADPILDPAEHDQLLRETHHELDDLRDDDAGVADRFFNLYCAPGHPYGRTTLGAEATLAHLDLAAAKTQRLRLLRRAELTIGIAGAIDAATARRAGDLLAGAIPDAPATPAPDLPDVRTPNGIRIFVIDKPARTQCQMLIGHTAPRYGTDDFLALMPLETAFGGMFSSRLMQAIRVERGWSYGAGCRLYRARLGHWFRIHLAPTADVAADALAMVFSLYGRLCADGLTADELSFAQGYLTGSLALARQTARQRMRQRVQQALLGLPPDYLVTLGDRITALGAPEVEAAAARWLTPRDLCAVVVATAADLVPRLEAAGYAVAGVFPYDSY